MRAGPRGQSEHAAHPGHHGLRRAGPSCDACDELGILVWHDCMFAYMDYPDDEAFLASVGAEVRQAFTELSSHPSLAIVCGNQEVEEIAAMSGGLAPRASSRSSSTSSFPRWRPNSCPASSSWPRTRRRRPLLPARHRREPVLRHRRVPATVRTDSAATTCASPPNACASPRHRSPMSSTASAAPTWPCTIPGGRAACTTTPAGRGTWTTSAPTTCARSSASIPSGSATRRRAGPRSGSCHQRLLDGDGVLRVALQPARRAAAWCSASTTSHRVRAGA